MRHFAGSPPGIFRAFGDSVTLGTAASPITNGYVYLLSTALCRPITNYGTNGDMVPDQTVKIYGINPAYGDISTIMLGVNDERIYGVNATTLGYYRRGLQCLAAYLGLGIKQFGVSSGVYTGTWVNTGVYGLGKSSTTNGSTATFSVNGTTVYLGMIQQDSAPGTFNVLIDGVTVGSYATQTTGLGPTINGVTYGAMLLRFPGLSAGVHSVQIVVTSATGAGNTVYIDWVAGNAQTVKPRVYVSNVIYAQAYTAGGSSANVDSYNAAITSLIAELVADGLNITAVNVNVLNLGVDMDGAYHPLNSGHVKLATAFQSAFV
ncbi:hypothetical protein SAMN05444159_1247 [Bradyrhizobium lablabi]|uniref:SGNH hydrolase-type esterase domain-containing protein n=1 Tax=Bradyrhizobium lablabi TaxID=722472 RepID=A0A1M6LDH5_9BRAD|nr:SGNH/GDSL hydrolase family protein [Bradyrhizobium lablabi]SHJ69260.1 hypothetical protein SAMN05444159_1247 [Bradyrhizobium lablabi]